jgi:hypothetical protein
MSTRKQFVLPAEERRQWISAFKWAEWDEAGLAGEELERAIEDYLRFVEETLSKKPTRTRCYGLS